MKIPNPSRVCFWSGAGISHDKPSNLPLGIPLTEAVIKEFCIEGTWITILHYLNHARLIDGSGYTKVFPRLEAVLEAIVSMTGYRALNYLSILDATPNHLHHFFAWHLANGGSHITVNLDDCITKAIRAQDNSIQIFDRPSNEIPPQSLINFLTHLHGRFSPDALEELGITVDAIAYGLKEDIKNSLQKLFQKMTLLIFIGYSGNDYFDINPFFLELRNRAARLNNLNVVWVFHKEIENGYLEEYHKNASFRNLIMDCLVECGATASVWHGRSRRFIEFFEKEWSIPRFSIGKKVNLSIPFMTDKDLLRPIVTANLYLSMGLGIEVLRIRGQLENYIEVMTSRSDLNTVVELNKIYYILNEGFREIGFYRKANRVLLNYTQSTPLSRLIYFKRMAGGHWLRGSVLRSWRLFRRGLRIGQGLEERADYDPKERRIFERAYFETNIRFLHLFRDIYRVPILRCLLPRKPALKALKNVFTYSQILRSSPYDRVYVVRLLHDLPFLRPEEELPSWLIDETTYKESSFDETDNILGSINTQRREILRRLSRGEEVTFGEMNLMYERSALINDLPGLLKASLIIRKHYKPDKIHAKRIWCSWIKIEWTRSRKVLWVIRYFWAAVKWYLSAGRKLWPMG